MSDSSHSQVAGARRTPTGERGRRRRELILETAAELLVEGGAEALSTNTIAERAQIAIGSVYQYFSNKSAVFAALGERYLEELRANTIASLEQDLTGLSVEEMVDAVVDPMIAFEREHPAFAHLDAGPEGSASLKEGALRIDEEVLSTIHRLMKRIRPDLPEARAWQIARATKALYKSMSYTIRQEPHITGAGGDVEAVLKDLKRALVLYLGERLEPSRP